MRLKKWIALEAQLTLAGLTRSIALILYFMVATILKLTKILQPMFRRRLFMKKEMTGLYMSTIHTNMYIMVFMMVKI